MQWARYESWQLPQLQRLAKLDPERVESVLNTLWQQYPHLYAELAVAAVDQEQLSMEDCAERLEIDVDTVENQLMAYRKASPVIGAVVRDSSSRHVARLANGQVAVWEIVREYRKLGSVSRLRDSFPGVPESDLAAALRYAQQNPEEIDALVQEYEDVLARKRAVYPYAS